MAAKYRVAILCNFPVWIANSTYPVRTEHYATWLTTLHDSFETQENYEIHWVILSRNDKKRAHFIAKNQHFHILPRISRQISLYTFFLIDRWQVHNELRRINPHLVHTWGTEDSYGLCGKDVKKAHWLHSVQGLLEAYIKRGPMSRYHCLLSKYETSVLKKARWLTTESPWASEQVILAVPNAKPIHFEYAVEQAFFDVKRELSPKPSFLYCGTDAPIKNIETLIDVFSSPRLSHVKLFLVGPSPTNWKNLPPNILVMGRLSRKETIRCISHSWGLIHLSKADTGPTVVKEARVLGLPVIVTNCCGSKQHVIHGKSGFIVDPNDKESIINYVLQITADKQTSLSMGSFDRERCREKLSPETMIKELLIIYNTILENR